MNAVLRVENVTVQFGGVIAVEEVSLQIEQGQMIGFIGPNGAGKTTLLRAVTGIVKPTVGRILLDGVDLGDWSIDRRVRAGLALAQQNVKPHRSMSMLENVTLACGAAKTRRIGTAMFAIDRHSEAASAGKLLARVGLDEVKDALPSTLPLGFLKRLEVARALALNPKLLLLDEPLAGLNQAEAQGMADLIRELNQQGQAILLIEHNLREVTRICQTLYVQDNGRHLAFGATREVMENPLVRNAYLGTRDGA